MKKFPFLIALVLGAAVGLGADEKKLPPMPAAVSGNAVASLKDGLQLFSLMGVGPRKTWDDVTNQVYIMNLAHASWSEGRQVPGVVGRVGAAAAGAKGLVILMGGYVVDGQGGELTVSDVNVYEPGRQQWSRGLDMPIAVDTAVTGVAHDRFVYLIGGRSPGGPVNNVQVYDVEKNSWTQATPFPGTPVFGLAGGVAGEIIVIIDGGGSDRDHKILFSGGTATPHDYKGAAYDGQPAAVSEVTFAYDLHGHKWETISENTYDPRADSRGILITPIGPVVLGGMVKNLAVTARVTQVPRK